MFQAALTVHDIDADSAIWTCTSIITDDRSSCRFSGDEEVSEYMYIINCAKADDVSEKIMQLCACRKYLCCEIFRIF